MTHYERAVRSLENIKIENSDDVNLIAFQKGVIAALLHLADDVVRVQGNKR